MTVHIIIPVHNRLDETIKCLDSVYNQTYRDYEIYVINDGSTDGTDEWLRLNNIKIIEGDGNLWWTGAIEKAVDCIINTVSSNDYLLTLNNDVCLDSDALSRLLEFSRSNSECVAGAISVDSSSKYCMSSGASVVSWMANVNRHPFRGDTYEAIIKTATEVDMLTGRCVLYPLKVIDKVGNFDSKSLPHYGGDIEMSIRVMRNNIKQFIVPGAIAYVNRDTTGLNADDKTLSLYDKLKSLFSIRSSNSLITRTKLAIKIAPFYTLPTYLLITYIKIITVVFLSDIKQKL